MYNSLTIENDNYGHSKRKNNFWSLLIVIYLTNFLRVGEYVPLLIIPFSIFIITKNKFSKNYIRSFIVLFLFGLFFSSLTYYYGFSSIFSVLGKFLYPLLFFELGYYLNVKKEDYKIIYHYLLVVITSLTIYGFLSVLKTIYLYGNMSAAKISLGGRYVVDLWSSNLISATGINSYFSLGMSLLPIIFIKEASLTKRYKCLIFFIFFISFFSIIQVSSRTGILILLCSIITVMLFGGGNSSKRIKSVVNIIFLLILIMGIYFLNLFSVKDIIENSNLYSRFLSNDVTNNPRFQAWDSTLFGLFDNPLGGRKTDLNLGFSHNLWLDVSYDTGIIPLVLLLIFTLFSLIEVIKFLRTDSPMYIKALIIGIGTSFFIVFMFEPVLQGMTFYFTIFCFYVGLIFRQNAKKITKEQNYL